MVYSVEGLENRTLRDQGLDTSKLARIGLARNLGKTFSNRVRIIFSVVLSFQDKIIFSGTLQAIIFAF